MSLLRIDDLSVSFPADGGAFEAVRQVSLRVQPGQTACIVGESGSGKSLTALAAMGLLPQGATLTGSILYDDTVVVENHALHTGHVQCGRGMAMVFQEPMASLNPSLTVLDIVGEAYGLRHGATREKTRNRVLFALTEAGIAEPEPLVNAYPWQLSGGLAQRVMIASALILGPRLLIADEPTTALDVTTQARILRLLHRLRTDVGLALVFITHDLTIAALLGGFAYVMYRGRIVEEGPTHEVLNDPAHPYTRDLVACTPAHALRVGRPRLSLMRRPRDRDGEEASVCAYLAHCSRAASECAKMVPLARISSDRKVLCRFAGKVGRDA